MEVDLNEPKSRAFNIFLRMFQLSLQLILGYWATHFRNSSKCYYNISDIVSYIAYALAAINFFALLINQCSKKFSRGLFWTVYILDLLIAAAIIAVQIILGHSECASANVFQMFSII
jgi:hypothetical protein